MQDPTMNYLTPGRNDRSGKINKIHPQDRPVHDWYRFVLSFPPHLVREYLQRLGVSDGKRVLDPFCGTGTTLVECSKLGVSSVGVEANPMAHFAAGVKVDWSPDPNGLLEHARIVAEKASAVLDSQGIEDDPLFFVGQETGADLRTLPRDSASLLVANSISPLPLHKALVLLDCLREQSDERYQRHELLALAKAIVYSSWETKRPTCA